MERFVPPELRQDPFTGNWVIIAPQRGDRPGRGYSRPRSRKPAEVERFCPFCPGHEDATPPEIWRQTDEHGNWRIRIVPNKFAVLSGAWHDKPGTHHGFMTIPGSGRHEVIIESPDHFADLASQPPGAVCDVLRAYRSRYRQLASEGASHIVAFRNHGSTAGASLSHPHSQIIALPIVPPDVSQRLETASDYVERTGVSLYADVLRREIDDGRRIVLAGERFVAFQPFASAAPFETWIMPRRQRASFGDVSDRELDELAVMLRTMLAAVSSMLDDPPYNYMIQSAPVGQENHPSFSWHLRLVPRQTIPAGFEASTGMQINPSLPEETAATLRRAVEATSTDEGLA